MTDPDFGKHEIYCPVYNERPRHFDDDDACTCGGQKWHPDCDGYVQSSERKNALYDRDRRENDLPPLPPSRTEDVPLTDKRWTDRTQGE